MSRTPKVYISPAGNTYGKRAQIFINAIASGQDNGTAYKLAGWQATYAAGNAAKRRYLYRFAIDAAVMDRMMAEQPLAYDIIVKIASEKETPAAVRLQAAKYIIDNGNTVRAGMDHIVKKEQTTAELIKSFCDSVGPQATALALNKIGIAVPDWINTQLQIAAPPGAPGTVQRIPAPSGHQAFEPQPGPYQLLDDDETGIEPDPG